MPARVWINETPKDEAGDYLEDQGLMCTIDGELVNVYEKWIWLMGNPINKQEYDFMRADSSHAKQYRPDDVKATPRRAIDLSTQKSIF